MTVGNPPGNGSGLGKPQCQLAGSGQKFSKKLKLISIMAIFRQNHKMILVR
jgi:hypothetical protein